MDSGILHLMLLYKLFKALRESISDSLRNPRAPSTSKHILPMETDILYGACSNISTFSAKLGKGMSNEERKGKQKKEGEKDRNKGEQRNATESTLF